MKKELNIFLLTGCFVMFFINSKGQQTESYTQYVYNHFALNPAVAGTQECTDIKIGSRLQWVGFDGAPMTNFVSVHKGFGLRKGTAKSLSWHGAGFYLIDDRAGTFQRTGFYPAYAYHFRVGGGTIASAGAFAGFKNFKFKGIQGSTDPVIGDPTASLIIPDVGIGLLLYSKRNFIGLSVKQLFLSDLSLGTNSKAIPQVYVTAGTKRTPLGYALTYRPSLSIKHSIGSPLSVDLNMMFFNLKETVGAGFGYRIGDALSANVQIQLIKRLSMGYAYEYPLSKVRLGTSQTHELILRWDPCWSKEEEVGGVDCPVF